MIANETTIQYRPNNEEMLQYKVTVRLSLMDRTHTAYQAIAIGGLEMTNVIKFKQEN